VGLYFQFELWGRNHGQRKVGSQKAKNQLAIWFLIKTQGTRVTWPLIEACDITLEKFHGKLQLCSWNFFINVHIKRLWAYKVEGKWESQDKKPFQCNHHGEVQNILQEESISTKVRCNSLA
jgi:hypothetical protein